MAEVAIDGVPRVVVAITAGKDNNAKSHGINFWGGTLYFTRTGVFCFRIVGVTNSWIGKNDAGSVIPELGVGNHRDHYDGNHDSDYDPAHRSRDRVGLLLDLDAFDPVELDAL